MPATLNIPTDTRYLAIDNTPLTQAAVEQLERNWTGKDVTDANWLARVIIVHGIGDQRFAHDVALGQLKGPRSLITSTGGRLFNELVAFRVSDATDSALQDTLRALPFALLMF